MWQAKDEQKNRLFSSILAEWSGPGAILAGVLFALWGSFGIVGGALDTVVPLLFLLGLAGLRIRCVERLGLLGEAGFVLGFVALLWGGVVRPFVNMTALYRYMVREGWPPWLSNWFAWLVVSLIMIGVAVAMVKALQDYGVLSLAVGMFGWLYFSTSSGGVLETYVGHSAFGALFCLGWIALGYALWKDAAGYPNNGLCIPDLRRQVRAVRSFVSYFASNLRR